MSVMYHMYLSLIPALKVVAHLKIGFLYRLSKNFPDLTVFV